VHGALSRAVTVAIVGLILGIESTGVVVALSR
jgi:hypothetical protein